MDKRTLAILAAIGAAVIYGLNHTIAKGVMPAFVKPFGFIFLRVTGAMLLFWLASFFVPKEKIMKKDIPRMFVTAMCGMSINMLSFFKGLSLSTPIYSSILSTITPILVLVLSAILIGEKLTLRKGTGIFIGFAGALVLILIGNETRSDAPNIFLGNLLFILNACVFGIYLILVKPLTAKYSTITLMKWLFLMAFIVNLPITYGEFSEISWSTMPFEGWWKIAFVVIGTTFMTYLLNVYALKTLAASTISSFIYLQPLIAIIYAISTGYGTLSPSKIAGGLLVFLGVYLVTKKPKEKIA
ncbi:Permease of the drug/metabolite transporter (DMT) superfamily [Pustulibacterium marinum]|uniref:Permease of the drug/metabolite transporter (DMT) superfamily n=1 Tax=Pustulibacterium marinum TaxID=1224947 RepID=A0A1I7I7Y7_9FLAO|nr:DMT family transporter [Pustulibacterium marinum]SFU69095.1 Permease of the drug/metabolite transporter (DMT) superfamily [Pustulibacterium marinum]